MARADGRGVLRALAVVVLVLLCWGATAPIANAHADDPARAASAALGAQLHRVGSPAAAYAVLDGDTVVTGASGDADQDTPFVIGSLSKSFTAVGVMRAVDAGLVDLDRPVTTYLPEFTTASSSEITVAQLLHHTSGLSTADGIRDLLEPERTLAQRVALARDFEPTAPPGERFQYSNINYAILGLLLEQVSGKTFAGYLRDEVVMPLGLSRTILDVETARDLIPGTVPFFGFAMPRPESEFPGALADGYIISTARDLLTYAKFHLSDGRGVLSPESMAALHEPGIGLPGDPDPTSVGYAMGWYTGESESHPVIHHEGDNFGYRTDIALYPELGRAIVVLMARNGAVSMVDTPISAALPVLAGGQPRPSNTYTVATWLVIALAATLLGTIAWTVLSYRRRARDRRAPNRILALSLILTGLALGGAALVAALLLVGGRASALPLAWLSAPDVTVLLIAWPVVLTVAGAAAAAQRRTLGPQDAMT
ncbi:serine hydrolase domain-containing protein [Nocardia mangyaensis]|uniref:serine hydrolase domain-containing protein n=1 Tax=Nocardia mangyaensis TaxID=2213200 RepID=UPI002677006D|nr:serine hydrolase domain-containing protein [Nocardia mangyaensis]MDO3649859.1 serine hydrolase domain-containing protein [Nocardia mangyaensis]